MATKVYDTLEIELQSGEVVEIKPLPIKRLRKASARLADFSQKATDGDFDDAESDVQDEFLDVLLDTAVLALQVKYPDLANREVLEDSLDMPTLNKIVEVATGWKFDQSDPKAATAAVGTT